MSVTVKTLIPAKQAEAAQTTQYTATNCKAIIDKFTATNTGSANQTISVNLVSTGDSPGAANLILDARGIAPGETYTLPELVGHAIDPNGYISTLASSTDITIRASGREIT